MDPGPEYPNYSVKAPDRPLAIAGLIAGGVPFVISYSETSSTSENGRITSFHYRDKVAIAGGGLAVLLGLVALLLALRNRGGAARIGLAAGALALGGFQLVRGFGLLVNTGDSSETTSQIETMKAMEPPPPPPAPDEKTCATPDDCMKVAGDTLKDHPDRAIAAASRACDLGSGKACSQLGTSLFLGDGGIAKDMPRGRQMFEKSCKLDFPDGCKNFGVALRDGDAVNKPDLANALQAFDHACELGNMDSCNEAGALYDNGKGAQRDRKRAAELFAKACDAKNGQACWNLALGYEQGGGVKKDLAQAYAGYKQACDLGYLDGCNDAAVMIGKAKGAPKDLKLKRELYQKACDGKVEVACKNLAALTKKH